jgi:WhiB family transcriptional regulator, redox-sensing transcriptional regulator
MPFPPATRNAPTPPYPYDGTEPCNSLGLPVYFGKTPADLNRARQVCAGCPLLEACSAWAVEHEEFGFWAGMTAPERERIRRERGLTLHRPEARGTRRPSVPKLAIAA